MEAYKTLIKNIALILFVGAIPSLCWASGIFPAISWPSFFLVLTVLFCALWIKARNSSQTFRKLLLTRGEAWGICDGTQITDYSPSFPAKSLKALGAFFHEDDREFAYKAINMLIHQQKPFQIKVNAALNEAIYSFEGDVLEDRFVFWLKNITDIEHKERLQLEALQKTEGLLKQLQSALDVLPILIWQRDKNLKIHYCNSAFAKAVQTTPEKIYENGIEFIQPRFAKLLAKKAYHTDEPQTFESPAIADGDRRHFRIWEVPNPEEPGTTFGLAYDITELKEIRSEIKRLIHAHDEVLAHLSTAISVFDSEGNLQYYNQAYVELYNFSESFLKSYPRLDEILEDLRHRRQLPEYADFPAYKKRRLQLLKEQVEPEEQIMHLPDERTLRIFSAPHPMGGLLFMFEDITDYLALERRNKTLLDAYQATLDNLFEGVVVIGSDNRLKILNPSFVRLWNFEEGDIKQDQHLTVVMENLKEDIDYDGDWETYKAQLIENVTDRVQKTGEIKRKDGTIVNYRYVPLPSGDHLLSYTDATDKFRAQHAMEEKNEALKTADKLKTEFIANVSYDLRSPLNTIIGFTEILADQYCGKLNERQIDYVKGVLDSSNNLLHLVDDILDLASIEAGFLDLEKRTQHIPTLLKEVVETISKPAEKNKQFITLHYKPEVKDWVLDAKRIKQALHNIINNAIKYTPAGGMITIEAHIKDGHLEISVSDTGVGMAPEEQARLIENLENSNCEKKDGSVIGLSLVKKLIELHQGQLDIKSDPSYGTKVTCVIPDLSGEIDEDPEESIISI